MERIIKYDYIDDKLTIMKKKIAELSDAKNKLNKDILLLENCFKGEDGELIKRIYLNKIVSIDKYMENVLNYLKYFEWLISSYKGTHYQAKLNLSSGLETQSNNINSDDYIFYDWE